jgi:hypothetical protein
MDEGDLRAALVRDLNERTRLRRITSGAVLLVTLGLSVAIATPKTDFKAGTPVSSKDLNDSFKDLDTRVATAAKPRAFGARIRMGGGCEVKPGASGAPTWVSCTPQAAGISDIKFAPNTFADTPACVVTPTSDITCSAVVNSSVSATVRCYFGSGATSSLADTDISLLCTATNVTP